MIVENYNIRVTVPDETVLTRGQILSRAMMILAARESKQAPVDLPALFPAIAEEMSAPRLAEAQKLASAQGRFAPLAVSPGEVARNIARNVAGAVSSAERGWMELCKNADFVTTMRDVIGGARPISDVSGALAIRPDGRPHVPTAPVVAVVSRLIAERAASQRYASRHETDGWSIERKEPSLEPSPLDRLQSVMAAHSLTRGDVARMLGLEPRPGGSHGTVDMWLSGARNIPASKLELIEIKAPNWKNSGQGAE